MTVVLQCVHNLTQGAFIEAKGPRVIEVRRMGGTSRASAISLGMVTPRSQGFPTSVTPRRADDPDATPAPGADRTYPPWTDRSAARGARRIEKRAECRIRPSNERHERRRSKNS